MVMLFWKKSMGSCVFFQEAREMQVAYKQNK